jgi:hypothetical protein
VTMQFSGLPTWDSHLCPGTFLLGSVDIVRIGCMWLVKAVSACTRVYFTSPNQKSENEKTGDWHSCVALKALCGVDIVYLGIRPA